MAIIKPSDNLPLADVLRAANGLVGAGLIEDRARGGAKRALARPCCNRARGREQLWGLVALQQVGLFGQVAEIFFAGDVFYALLAGEAGAGFVFHFEAFGPHDTDIFLPLFPDLALAQLHVRHNSNQRQGLP